MLTPKGLYKMEFTPSEICILRDACTEEKHRLKEAPNGGRLRSEDMTVGRAARIRTLETLSNYFAEMANRL